MTSDTTLFKQRQRIAERLRRAAKAQSFAGASNALFGGVSDRYSHLFLDLKEDLKKADISVLYRTYVSELFAITSLATITGFGLAVIIDLMAPVPTLIKMSLFFALPLMTGAAAFSSLYFYPTWKAKKRAADIKSNLPFALNHMSAVAGSGVPPSSMFDLLVNFHEYGEISKEARKISTKVYAFGEDITTAIREVAHQTPSEDLEEVFYGIIATIETGGSLEAFLEESASRSLFEYRLEREKQIERLTTFASFYTAILVAAPLFLITILAILEVIGGELFGLPIKSSCGIVGSLTGKCPMGVIDMGAFFLIPIANAAFIILLEVTQPEI